jgi:hypothetical protein
MKRFILVVIVVVGWVAFVAVFSGLGAIFLAGRKRYLAL